MNESASNWLEPSYYANNRTDAILALGKALFRGELVLLLGAGVSLPFGLPLWSDLLSDCGKRAGVILSKKEIRSKKGALEAGQRIKDAAGSSNYCKILHDVLYHEMDRYTPTPLLAAVSALVSGSARGKVNTVVTLNFDDLLETFLLLNGYDVDVISTWPRLTRASDVQIIHPHGFLPRRGGIAERFFKSSSGVVLGTREFGNILNKRTSKWREILRSLLSQKIVLVVGVGPGEPHMRKLLREIASENPWRPTGFWMVKQDPSDIRSPRIEKFFNDCRMVPIGLPDYDGSSYPDFLQDVCKSAATHLASACY